MVMVESLTSVDACDSLQLTFMNKIALQYEVR